ncbi:hypothetical protein FQN54_005104 [Arachnomyces sp. PD_36]|nr:hypothetical protein FQN54_005104 [Arachnomyces sp. PD_36]
MRDFQNNYFAKPILRLSFRTTTVPESRQEKASLTRTGEAASIAFGIELAEALAPLLDSKKGGWTVADFPIILRSTAYMRCQDTLWLASTSFVDTLKKMGHLKPQKTESGGYLGDEPLPIHYRLPGNESMVPYGAAVGPRCIEIYNMVMHALEKEWAGSANLEKVNHAVRPWLHPDDRQGGVSLIKVRPPIDAAGLQDHVPPGILAASVGGTELATPRASISTTRAAQTSNSPVELPQEMLKRGQPGMFHIIDTVHVLTASEDEQKDHLKDRFPDDMLSDLRSVLPLAEEYIRNWWYSAFAYSEEFRRLSIGRLAGEMGYFLGVFGDDHRETMGKVEQRQNPLVALMCGHDATIDALLAGLGVPSDYWPPPLSHIMLVRYRERNGGGSEKYVRLLFNGKPVPLPGARARGVEGEESKFYRDDPTLATIVRYDPQLPPGSSRRWA